jgi:hypothetical protein
MKKQQRGLWLPIVFLIAGMANAKEGDYRPPRLPDGHVDMQGVWTHTNLMPLERPAEFSSLVITAEQAAKVKADEDADENNLLKPSEPSEYFDVLAVQRIRGELHSSVIIDPQNGMIPGNALFKESKARARASLFGAFDGPEQRPLSERCVASPNSSPPVLIIPSNDFRQIVQTKDAVVFAAEAMHDTRIIRMNAKHAPAAVVTWTGDSIGWWDHDTLVVETKYLMPSLVGRSAPHGMYFVSPLTTVTERLTRIAKEQISYVFTVEDPTFYTQSWTGETVFVFSAEPIYEFACHEGNYSMSGALMGARVQEANGGKK